MNSQILKNELMKLGAIKIKQIAQACGSPTTGNKGALINLLCDAATSRLELAAEPFRLVSVDLGIKNIGITQLWAPALTAPGPKPIMEKWYRGSLPEARSFTYPEFANMAIKFTTDLVEQLDQPVNGVIIERQRARTSSSPNIPSQILKVNIVEGMAFTALRVKYPTLFLESIPPKYILSFWKSQTDMLGQPKPKTAAVNYRTAKKARQKLVGSWLAKPAGCPVDFSTHGLADHALKHGKRDDIDDSLVQALTWLLWRRNTYRVFQNLESGIDPMYDLEIPRAEEQL